MHFEFVLDHQVAIFRWPTTSQTNIICFSLTILFFPLFLNYFDNSSRYFFWPFKKRPLRTTSLIDKSLCFIFLSFQGIFNVWNRKKSVFYSFMFGFLYTLLLSFLYTFFLICCNSILVCGNCGRSWCSKYCIILGLLYVRFVYFMNFGWCMTHLNSITPYCRGSHNNCFHDLFFKL